MKFKQISSLVISISMLFYIIAFFPYTRKSEVQLITTYATEGRKYNQNESRWYSPAFEPVIVNGVTHYPSKEGVGGNNLHDGGCSIFSFCNAIYALNGSVADPVEVGWWGCNGKGFWPGYQGANPWQLYSNIESGWGEKLGFTVSASYQNGSAGDLLLKNHLKNGDVAVAHITGHFIALAGYDESSGNYLVIDSACMYNLPAYGWVSESKLKSGGSCVTAYILFKNTKNITPHLDFLDYSLPSGRLEPGKFFPINGIISGYPNIDHVWGGVYNSDGSQTAQWCEQYPDSSSYNLANYFDAHIIFNDLPVGNYIYKIEATTKDGQHQFIQSEFQIGDPPPPISYYTVYLNANGGEVSPGSITVQTDGVYSGLPAPSRYGYDFKYWADESGREVSDGTGIYTNADHTLYANWNPKSATVNLNANGGTVSPDTIQVSFDGNYNNLPNPVKSGYSFAGWFTSVEGGSQININSVCNTADEHTLYAHWTKDNYTITFNAMGGTVEITSKLAIYGSKYGFLPVPEKKNAKFAGWFTADGVQVTSSSIVTGSAELYAKWKLTGDINADEKLTIADAVLLQKYLLVQIKFSEDEYYAGDINSDGSVDVFDMVFMRKILTEE